MTPSQAGDGNWQNLWAPWRMEYIRSLSGPQEGCFLCAGWEESDRDKEHLVLWRGKHSFAILNRYPYTGGHCLIAPAAHEAALEALSPACLLEMMELVRDLERCLREALHPHGFNVGINIGRCAGAGLPDHVHMHIVPRWDGDTNFMPVFGNVHVVPDYLENIRREILQAGQSLGLPSLSGEAGS